MMELDRIKRNVAKMVDQKAPESDIDSYIQSEGTTVEAVRAFKPETKSGPSWWQRNITGVEDPNVGKLPSVYSQYPQDLSRPTNLAALAGASDAQMTDIIQKQLGDRFVRREKDANGYDIIVTRVQDGQEQKGYINRPGLDMEDVSRGIHGALPYVGTGAVGAVAGVGRGILANAAIQGGTGAATSVAGDVAQMPLGSEQGIEGGKAAMISTLSAGGPIAGRMIGNGVAAVRDRLAPVAPELSGFSPRAVRRVEEAIQADGNLTPQSFQGASQMLGPEGMLGDMGRTLQTDTARLARMPVSGDPVIQRLNNRQAAAPDRIRSDLDANLGPERNLPQYIDQQAASYNRQAKPYYDQFNATSVRPTENLQSIIEAAKASGAYDLALKKMQVKRLDPNLAENNGQFLDLIKRELDGMAGVAERSGNRSDLADYSGLAKALRGEVDEILSPGNPAQSPWAQGRAIAGEGLEGREAVELGSKVFSGKKDPYLVEAELTDMSQFGRDMYREGARNDLRGVMGRSSSNFGPKGDAAARRSLNSEFSRQNLDQIAGPTAASNISRRIDAENAMAETFDLAKGNSVTSTMEASKSRWPTPNESKFASEAGKKGPVGLATEGVFKIADALLGGQMKKAEARAALDGARILTATGRERDKVVNALFRHIDARKAGRISSLKYEKLVRELVGASRVPAVQYQD